MKSGRKFEKALLKTVDGELKQIFGENATHVIYNYLKHDQRLEPKEIPQKIDVFFEGLHNFLGSGACVVEQTVLKKLHLKYGRQYQTKEGYTFVDYIAELKKSLRNNK
ncbi:MAG: hypothetical protein U9O89_01110 [Thermoproteota archaeon]|nr:hypothetical protein [Thermoproteota archaeon]